MGGNDGARPRGASVLDRLDADLTRKLEESYRRFSAAAGGRARFDAADPAVRRCEGWFQPEASEGKTLKAAVAAVKEAVGAARDPCLEVRETEVAALSLFREVLTALAAGNGRKDAPLPPGVLPDLEEWARLRALELEWMDGVIQHSNQILQQPPNSPWDRFRALLGLRRGCCERAASVRRDYQVLERRTRAGATPAPAEPEADPPPRKPEEPRVKILDPAPEARAAAGSGPDEVEAELTVLGRVVADRLEEIRQAHRTARQRTGASHAAELDREKAARAEAEARAGELRAECDRLAKEAEKAAAGSREEVEKVRALVAAREAELAETRGRLAAAEQALERVRAAYRTIHGALASVSPPPAAPPPGEEKR